MGIWRRRVLPFCLHFNNGYANMNALFTVKNSIKYNHALFIEERSQTGFAGLKIDRVDDDAEDL